MWGNGGIVILGVGMVGRGDVDLDDEARRGRDAEVMLRTGGGVAVRLDVVRVDVVRVGVVRVGVVRVGVVRVGVGVVVVFILGA